MKMLKAMGYPTGLAAMQADMYSQLVRHIKSRRHLRRAHATRVRDGARMLFISDSCQCHGSYRVYNAPTPYAKRRKKQLSSTDRTLDASDVRQLEAARGEVVRMDKLMGPLNQRGQVQNLGDNPADTEAGGQNRSRRLKAIFGTGLQVAGPSLYRSTSLRHGRCRRSCM